MVNDKMVNDKMVNDKMVNDKMVNDKMVNLFVPQGAVIFSEWIPTLNLFREGACRNIRLKNRVCVRPAGREPPFEGSLLK